MRTAGAGSAHLFSFLAAAHLRWGGAGMRHHQRPGTWNAGFAVAGEPCTVGLWGSRPGTFQRVDPGNPLLPAYDGPQAVGPPSRRSTDMRLSIAPGVGCPKWALLKRGLRVHYFTREYLPGRRVCGT